MTERCGLCEGLKKVWHIFLRLSVTAVSVAMDASWESLVFSILHTATVRQSHMLEASSMAVTCLAELIS